jgi:glutathione S-transferase
MAPELELYYWPITGLAEPIRLALTIGGFAFKDFSPANLGMDAFNAKCDEADSQVPFLIADGKVLQQSRAIIRYVGKLANYDGKPLYPTDPMEAFNCDELIELIEDARAPLAKTFAIDEQAAKEAARAALFAGAAIPASIPTWL